MVEIIINGEKCFAPNGAKLSRFLIESGIRLPYECGGKGTCGKCRVKINGKEELACRYKIKENDNILLPECGERKTEFENNGLHAENIDKNNLIGALDLGSTTLAFALVDLKAKKVIATATAQNPQTAFGADVISRIELAANGGTEKLRKAAIDGITDILEKLKIKKLQKLLVAGNSAMTHLLLGVNPEAFGRAPYKMSFSRSQSLSGESIGLPQIGEVITAPLVSAFFGGDIVSGISYIGFPETGKFNLLADLGTNAEIALFSKNKILCTSAAAGSCFEGANISSGMPAVEGAISEFTLNNNLCEFNVIGEKKPQGICATGLIDIIAELLKAGIIDRTGYMEAGEFTVCPGVSLTQKDIRQYQLAKSAVYSAIKALLREANLSFSDIECFYISGGFAESLNLKNAALTGLIPEELWEKCRPLKNSSLSGLVKWAVERTMGSFDIDAEKGKDSFGLESAQDNASFGLEKEQGKVSFDLENISLGLESAQDNASLGLENEQGNVSRDLEEVCNSFSCITHIAEYIDLSTTPDFSTDFLENMEF